MAGKWSPARPVFGPANAARRAEGLALFPELGGNDISVGSLAAWNESPGLVFNINTLMSSFIRSSINHSQIFSNFISSTFKLESASFYSVLTGAEGCLCL